MARNEHTSGIFPHTALTCHSSSSIVAFQCLPSFFTRRRNCYIPCACVCSNSFFCPCCFSLRDYSDAKLFFVLKSVLFCTSLYYFSFRAPLQTPPPPHAPTHSPHIPLLRCCKPVSHSSHTQLQTDALRPPRSADDSVFNFANMTPLAGCCDCAQSDYVRRCCGI